MKKLFHIVFATALLLGAAACTDLLDPNLRGLGRTQQVPENAKVTLYFSVPEDVKTKADMAELPSISTMHVFVFNKVGMLIETAKAKQLGSVTANGTDAAKHWAVDLQMGAAERHLHFIADLPADFEIPATGSEASLLASITTKAPAAAYWQRIVLEHGIDAYRYNGTGQYSYVDPTTGEKHTVAVPGTVSGDTYSYEDVEAGETITITVNKGDYINSAGKKILDAKGLYASEELQERVSLIPMIRNFAQIHVKSSMSTFTILQAALINTPKEGFVAPYNDIANEFVAPYMEAGTTTLTEAAVKASGYTATIPAAGIDVPTKDPETQKLVGVTYKTPVTVDGDTYVPFFMYERHLPTENPTSLLIQGTLNGSTKWFKIEIADEDGDYFPIYRNFTYVVDIKGLSADGYDTPEEAVDNAPVGDLSASTETATLNQISDGKGLRLWVEYIDYTDMDANPNEHTVTLLYKLSYTSSAATPVTTILNEYVEPTIKAYANTDAAIKSFTTAAYTGPDESTPDGQSGWNQATVTLYGVGENMKKSDLHVLAELTAAENPGGYAKKISRDVTYRVLPKQPLTVTATPLTSDAADMPTTVTITLPPNLGYSVFPLTLMIEAGNNGLMTTEGLAVESGETISGIESKTNTFYFLKTVAYSEYEASRSFTCSFKTTKGSSDTYTNATTIYVKDKEGRFEVASCELTAPGSAAVFALSTNSVTVNPDQTKATFVIRSSTSGTWNLTTSDPENVKVSPASGTGNRTVTVTFPKNTSHSTTATHTVTASLEGFENQTFTITQDPVSFNFTETAVSVRGTARRATVGLVSNGPGTWTLTASNGATLSDGTQSGTTITGTGSKDITISFPENTSSTAVDYTITGSMEGFDNQVCTITQRALVRREITFTTNQRNVNFPNGTNAKTNDGVTLDFGSSIRGRNNNYLEISDGGQFSISTTTEASIKSIKITYTDYNYGRSGYNNNYSTSDPATSSGHVYATENGTTGTWTGDSQTVNLTMYRYRSNNNNYYTRISSIVVTTEE